VLNRNEISHLMEKKYKKYKMQLIAVSSVIKKHHGLSIMKLRPWFF